MGAVLKRRKDYTITKRAVGNGKFVLSINIDPENKTFLNRLEHAAWNVSLRPLSGDLADILNKEPGFPLTESEPPGVPIDEV